VKAQIQSQMPDTSLMTVPSQPELKSGPDFDQEEFMDSVMASVNDEIKRKQDKFKVTFG